MYLKPKISSEFYNNNKIQNIINTERNEDNNLLNNFLNINQYDIKNYQFINLNVI